jgi:starch synthase
MSMRYGTVPIVRWTGGLADTVEPYSPGAEGGTGIAFAPYTPESLVEAVEAALRLYGDPRHFQRVRRNGMARDFSWEASGRKYLQLYRQANASKRMGTGYHKWLETVQESGRGRRA